MKKSKDNIKKMQKAGKTFDSSFISGHLSKEELDLQKADGSQTFFNVGHVGEKEISDNIKKELNRFIDDYYDRYTGLYLKSKDFLKKINNLIN